MSILCDLFFENGYKKDRQHLDMGMRVNGQFFGIQLLHLRRPI